MALWALTPVDLADPNWEARSHRGPALARAPSTQKARATAAHAFDLRTGFKPQQAMRVPPWRRAGWSQWHALTTRGSNLRGQPRFWSPRSDRTRGALSLARNCRPAVAEAVVAMVPVAAELY